MYKQGRLKHKGRDCANSVSALVPIFVSIIRVLEVIMALGKKDSRNFSGYLPQFLILYELSVSRQLLFERKS